MFRIVLTLSILAIVASNARAQHDVTNYEISGFAEHDKLNFHLSPLITVPTGQLKDAVNNKMGNLGVGIASGIFFNPYWKKKHSPIFIGADFSWLTYGVDRIDETATVPPLKTSFNIYSFQGGGRLLLNQDKKFVPFVDGLLGVQVFNTRTKVNKNAIQTVVFDEEEELINSTNNAGLSYSLAIGFYTRKEHNEYSLTNPCFSVRLLFMWGDDAKYVKRNSVEVSPNFDVTYETARMQPTMFQLQFGLLLY